MAGQPQSYGSIREFLDNLPSQPCIWQPENANICVTCLRINEPVARVCSVWAQALEDAPLEQIDFEEEVMSFPSVEIEDDFEMVETVQAAIPVASQVASQVAEIDIVESTSDWNMEIGDSSTETTEAVVGATLAVDATEVVAETVIEAATDAFEEVVESEILEPESKEEVTAVAVDSTEEVAEAVIEAATDATEEVVEGTVEATKEVADIDDIQNKLSELDDLTVSIESTEVIAEAVVAIEATEEVAEAVVAIEDTEEIAEAVVAIEDTEEIAEAVTAIEATEEIAEAVVAIEDTEEIALDTIQDAVEAENIAKGNVESASETEIIASEAIVEAVNLETEAVESYAEAVKDEVQAADAVVEAVEAKNTATEAVIESAEQVTELVENKAEEDDINEIVSELKENIEKQEEANLVLAEAITNEGKAAEEVESTSTKEDQASDNLDKAIEAGEKASDELEEAVIKEEKAEEEVQEAVEISKTIKSTRESDSNDNEPFLMGDLVSHGVYGIGTVLQLNKAGKHWSVEVSFKEGKRRILGTFLTLNKIKESPIIEKEPDEQTFKRPELKEISESKEVEVSEEKDKPIPEVVETDHGDYLPGTTISHVIFGIGKIKNSEPKGDAYRLDLIFEDGTERTLLSTFVKLLDEESSEPIPIEAETEPIEAETVPIEAETEPIEAETVLDTDIVYQKPKGKEAILDLSKPEVQDAEMIDDEDK